MLTLLPCGRILVAVEPVDARKGIDSLAGVVQSVLKGDPLSGDLFVFKTRRADKLKILSWMTAGRREEFPQAFLDGYAGFIHADAYDGYNADHTNVRHLGCWTHARRYFVEAEPGDPRAVEALAFIRTLYAVERDIKVERGKPEATFNDADVVRVRRTRAGPILSAFADWLKAQHRSTTPKSLFA